MSTPKPAPDRASRLALARKLTEALPVLDGPGSGSFPVSLGCDVLASFLPGGGLGREAFHEVAPDSAADGPAALGFLAALMARGLEGAEGSALIVTAAGSLSGSGQLYGHGLNGLGLDPGRLIVVETDTDTDALWALEESLRARALPVVAGLVASPIDIKASRRLQLAAAGSGAFLVVMRPAEADEVNAARTRWRVGAAPAGLDRFGCFERVRWRLTLERCRNGRPGAWIVEWNHETRGFRLAPAVAGDALPPRAGEGEHLGRLAG